MLYVHNDHYCLYHVLLNLSTINFNFLRFVVLIASKNTNYGEWIVTPWNLVDGHQRFEEICSPRLQNITSTVMIEAASSSATLIPIYQISWHHNQPNDRNLNIPRHVHKNVIQIHVTH
jgi:hypothetical protein